MADYKNSKERALLAREIAREGIVLLKNNDNMLPFGKECVAVFGRTQIDTIKCGTGSAYCESEYMSDILSGMINAGINTDTVLAEKYRKWCAENKISAFGVWGSGTHINPEMPLSSEDVRAASERASKAVFVIGRTAGENDDSIVTEGDFLLSSAEKSLLEDICANFDDVAIVVNSGNLIDLSFTENKKIKAVVLLNLPGMEGGNALGELLCGKYSPSGKLTDTVARDYSDYPSSDFFGKKTGIIQNYYEDIYVGYRYFETFEKAKKSVLYPFGHGLSYTNFEIKPLSFCADSDSYGYIKASVAVKNTGERYSGKEVVMLYSSSPKSALGAPAFELRAFTKTKTLSPGETETVCLSFPIKDMASFDDTGVLGTKNAWVMAKGNYGIFLGNNVEKLVNIGFFEKNETEIVKICADIPTELDKRLILNGEYEELSHIPTDLSRGIPIEPKEKTKISAENYYSSDVNSVTYKINVSASGAYTVKFKAKGAVAEKAEVSGNGIFNIGDFYSSDGADMILPFGSTEIKFSSDVGVPLTEMSFIKNDAPIKISGSDISVIEGGKYDECALYVVNRSFCDTDEALLKNGKGLYRMHTPGRYAMYKLDVERAGYYDIKLRYSTSYPSHALSDTFSFIVSNVLQDTERVMLTKTSENERKPIFKTSPPIRLSLPCGETYLKIVSSSTETPFVSYFEVSPSERTDVVAEKTSSKNPEGNIAFENGAKNVRRELSASTEKYDFRRVLKGELSADDFINSLDDEKLASLTCGNPNGQIGYFPENGVPEAYWSDGPVGFRQNFKVSVYPSATMVSSSWNTHLAYEFGKAAGTEARLYNIDVWLAPAMNIHRNPCCGRNFEYHSEDPYVTSEIVCAIVKGVQSCDIAATVKHFAANNTEYQRLRSDSRVSARALREIYMRAFERVIKNSSPYAVMTSYNFINGIKVCENPVFCRDVIRNDFGYDGVLMSDFGNDSLHVKEIAAGHDLKMPVGDVKSILSALSDGTLSRENVRLSAKRVLSLIEKTVGKMIKY